MKTSIFSHVIMGGLSAAMQDASTASAVELAEDDLTPILADGALPTRRRIIAYADHGEGVIDMTPTPWIGVSITARESVGWQDAGREPVESVSDFTGRLGEMRGPAEMENHISTELEFYSEALQRLEYIEGIFGAIMHNRDRFSLGDRARLLHYLTCKIDESEIPVAEHKSVMTLIGVLRQLSLSMGDVETAQLSHGAVPRVMALQIADTYHAFARKSDYLRYRINMRRGAKPMRQLRLASTLLRLRDVARRYGLERDDAGLASVLSFIKEMRAQEAGLSQDDVTWAYNQIIMFTEQSVSEWTLARKTRGEKVPLQGSMRFFDLALKDLLRSLYLYSPFVLRDVVTIMRDAGLGDMASMLSQRAEVHMERALKLKLLPHGARHKLKLI